MNETAQFVLAIIGISLFCWSVYKGLASLGEGFRKGLTTAIQTALGEDARHRSHEEEIKRLKNAFDVAVSSTREDVKAIHTRIDKIFDLLAKSKKEDL